MRIPARETRPLLQEGSFGEQRKYEWVFSPAADTLDGSQLSALQFRRVSIRGAGVSRSSLCVARPAADSLRQGAGEGTSLMTEQLAFDQTGGNRRAVQFDERSVAPGAHVVDRLRHQLLSGAGFSLDQNRRVSGRDNTDLLYHPGE